MVVLLLEKVEAFTPTTKMCSDVEVMVASVVTLMMLVIVMLMIALIP